MITKSEMTERAEQLNQLAARAQEMPDGLTQPEQMLYICLRALYVDYSRGVVNRQQATAEKAKLFDAYIDAAYTYQCYQHYRDIAQVFHREFHRDGNGCAKPGECRLYNIISGIDARGD